MGALQLGEPVFAEQVVDDILRGFLSSIDPGELEVRALSLLGGLEGEESVGAAVIRTLREMAGLE